MNDFEYGFYDENEMMVTLTLEDDSELVCGVVAVFSVNEKDYIALTPIVEGSVDLFLYRLGNENGDTVLESIDDDEEFDEVASAYELLVEEK